MDSAVGVEGLAEYVAGAKLGEFKPRPYYERHTDALVFYARNERSHGKRLNDSLTLFLSLTDHSLVGLEIKGVKRLAKIGKDRFFVKDSSVPLSILVDFARVPEPIDEALEDRYLPEMLRITENVEVGQEMIA